MLRSSRPASSKATMSWPIFTILLSFLTPRVHAIPPVVQLIFSHPTPKLGGNATETPLAIDVPSLNQSIFSRDTYSGIRNPSAEPCWRLHQLAPIPPSSFDWRNYGSVNWLCTIQDQGSCESCWAYATAALFETQLRTEHGYWAKRSEGDIRDGKLTHEGVPAAGICAQSSSLGLEYVSIFGAVDEQCFPTVNNAGPDPYEPCLERVCRTSRAPDGTDVGTLVDQKNWIANIGPLTATIEFETPNILQAFADLKPSQIFTAPAPIGTDYGGQHNPLVVGYDDTGGYWIVRNSWNTWWADKGYGLIKYGEIRIDDWSKQGLALTEPDLWVKRRSHNGNMIHKNDDIVSTSILHKEFGLIHCGYQGVSYQVRGDGFNGQFPWKVIPQYERAVEFEPQDYGQCEGQPSLTAVANVDFPSLELLYWNGVLDQVEHLRFASGWIIRTPFGDGKIGGYPGLIQGNYGHPGNLEAVVRHIDGSLNHWSFDNVTSDGFFFNAQIAPPKTVLMSGPALIQSNAGINGNFYVAAVLRDGSLGMFWRNNDDPTNLVWEGTEVIASGAFGARAPVMIQTLIASKDENTVGDFDVLIVNSMGCVEHYRRNNDDIRQGGQPVNGPSPAWTFVDSFCRSLHFSINVWSFMQGPFTQNLEAVVENIFGELELWFGNSIVAGQWKFGGIAPAVN